MLKGTQPAGRAFRPGRRVRPGTPPANRARAITGWSVSCRTHGPTVRGRSLGKSLSPHLRLPLGRRWWRVRGPRPTRPSSARGEADPRFRTL